MTLSMKSYLFKMQYPFFKVGDVVEANDNNWIDKEAGPFLVKSTRLNQYSEEIQMLRFEKNNGEHPAFAFRLVKREPEFFDPEYTELLI